MSTETPEPVTAAEAFHAICHLIRHGNLDAIPADPEDPTGCTLPACCTPPDGPVNPRIARVLRHLDANRHVPEGVGCPEEAALVNRWLLETRK